MNLRQAFLGMIKAFPGGWDSMCGALAINRVALTNRIYECKGMDVGVNMALQMQEFSQTTLFAEAVAAMSGGTFLKLPEIDTVCNEEISEKFHEAMETLGKLSIEYRDAVKDGEVNSREREKLNAIIDQMHIILNQIMALTIKVYCRETKANARGDA